MEEEEGRKKISWIKKGPDNKEEYGGDRRNGGHITG